MRSCPCKESLNIVDVTNKTHQMLSVYSHTIIQCLHSCFGWCQLMSYAEIYANAFNCSFFVHADLESVEGGTVGNKFVSFVN